MHWIDLFKIFQITFEADPQTKKQATVTGAGRATTEVPYLKGDPYGGGSSSLRVGGDTIDFSNLQSRSLRLKEYERLRSIPEIEKAMTVIADEACLVGDTIVSTLYDGDKSIQWLAENKANEEFHVYSYDFEARDYTLAIAYNPRKVGTQMTYKVILDDGTEFIATPDHLVLLKDRRWTMVNQLQHGDELMPFYRLPANQNLTRSKKNQFPRIYSLQDGWKHERQFIDDWKNGKSSEKHEKINKICRLIASGLKSAQVAEIMNDTWVNLRYWIQTEGYSFQELKWLGQKKTSRRVLSVAPHKEMDVYDLSVRDHKNFCGQSVVFHNCQKNEDENIFSITVKNAAIKKELEYLMFNRKMLNMNRQINGWFKRLCINGDLFLEIIILPDQPKKGILKVVELPPETMFRIESVKGKLFEFQQAQDEGQGPDEQAILKNPLDGCSDEDLLQTNVLRFRPEQIVHIRLGEQRKTFYPYGLSLIEPARSPALQLKLMEDSMIVYRLTRAPERKIFYVDTQSVPGFKIPNYIARLQDLMKKRKVARSGDGASGIDEKWSGLAVDDDIWLPTRQGSNTRIETLPGAQNLGEIDDTVYFRNKLYIALNLPENYFTNQDINTTRITLSAQNANVSRMIQRLQESFEDGLYEIADRHLKLLGYPEEMYDDLKIKMTVPSEWQELSKAEVVNQRLNVASSYKGQMLMSDIDILVKILKYSQEEAEQLASRMSIQKLQDARLQILVANPSIAGMGVPGQGEEQMGVEAGGGGAIPAPDAAGGMPMDPAMGGMGGAPMEPVQNANDKLIQPQNQSQSQLEDPTPEEIRKYDLEISSNNREREDVDYSEES